MASAIATTFQIVADRFTKPPTDCELNVEPTSTCTVLLLIFGSLLRGSSININLQASSRFAAARTVVTGSFRLLAISPRLKPDFSPARMTEIW